jgi:Putative polyhydroxyalkanoic acid system protein (PHA_gran_rgn)
VKLAFSQAHTRDLASLKAHAQQRIALYAGRYPALGLADHFRWVSERVAEGSYQGGTGTVTLDEREMRVELSLPFFARPFRTRIEDFVRRELAQAATP